MSQAEIAAAVRDTLLPLADAATPNAFECAWLAGHEDGAAPDLAALAKSLPPPVVLVTSAPALMRGMAGNLLVDGDETVLFEHPLIDTPIKGTGDLLTGLVTARRLQGRPWPAAAEAGARQRVRGARRQRQGGRRRADAGRAAGLPGGAAGAHRRAALGSEAITDGTLNDAKCVDLPYTSD